MVASAQLLKGEGERSLDQTINNKLPLFQINIDGTHVDSLKQNFVLSDRTAKQMRLGRMADVEAMGLRQYCCPFEAILGSGRCIIALYIRH